MSERILITTEQTRFGNETGAGLMRNRCAFTARDMSADWPEAFTYAIVMGWDDADDPECDSMPDVAAYWDWDEPLIAFLRDAHERFKALADRTTAPAAQTEPAAVDAKEGQ